MLNYEGGYSSSSAMLFDLPRVLGDHAMLENGQTPE